MSKKNFITIGATLIHMLLPNISFPETINNNTDKLSGLYISGQYKPGISHFSKFSVKEIYNDNIQLIGLRHNAISTSTLNINTDFNIPYKVTFQNNITSFSGAIGYSDPTGARFELEGSYEEFDVTDPGDCLIKDTYRYFALARNPSGSSPTSNNYTVMRNDGVSITSVIFNGCYDIFLKDLEVSPYVCVGVGGDFIEFFDALHIKLAYQGKLGINYHLSTQASVFIDGYYHKVIGNQFNNLNVQHVASTDFGPVYAVATLNIGYFGGEIGIRLTF
ncbi:major outer membrane protein OMP-1X [Ehrlichia chaffeensis str. Arkansas]|uniref:Major outer membrane protein OMP-1X n=2 Tax=Ehrlichia chaffeensis TaxID=945 RepID=Q2GF69_EHRCR|nr:P44/Msp2 family outer membrane protein [Ehrlichia chaffeensis]AAF73417.1 P28-8 [Ehrlichia chaffeensis]AAK28668.1 major outer membrane protein OMP-1X [Ehrlichia chaffeensis]ABD45503.1 major outer membrane protein OMP-1X [Ehrlichia chaffeensis str. Arkansas]AHX08041.1 surface antigen family protein [Ehrlichia chaffeensis str. Osceola]